MVGWCGSQTKAKEYHDLCIRLHSIFAKLLRSTDVKLVHIFLNVSGQVLVKKYFQIIHKHLAGVFLILFFFADTQTVLRRKRDLTMNLGQPTSSIL